MPTFETKTNMIGRRLIRCRCLQPWDSPDYRMSAGAIGDIEERIAEAAIEAGYLEIDRATYGEHDPLKRETRKKVTRRRKVKSDTESEGVNDGI